MNTSLSSIPDKLVVLDANAFWTEQLFTACGRFAEVLLLKPRDFRAHQANRRTIRSDRTAKLSAENILEQQISMPPGWMFSLWPWSARRLAKDIRKFVGSSSFALVITYPQYRSLLTLLRPDVSIYYNLDDYSDNWPNCAEQMEQWENETVAASDIIICIARHRRQLLQARVPAKATAVYHLPLGATPQLMAAAPAQRVLDLPSLRGIAPPRAGYVGALNARFDYHFLVKVAERLPEVQFVLAGKIPEETQGDAGWFQGVRHARSLPNVNFIGWVEHNALGEFLQAFEVLFMCYSDCRFNRNASPAKLWDYLGSSRPVVANDRNPETLLWREVIRVGDTPEAFVRAIKAALAEHGNALQARRLEIAHDHTWEQLSRRLEKIITLRMEHLC